MEVGCHLAWYALYHHTHNKWLERCPAQKLMYNLNAYHLVMLLLVPCLSNLLHLLEAYDFLSSFIP